MDQTKQQQVSSTDVISSREIEFHREINFWNVTRIHSIYRWTFEKKISLFSMFISLWRKKDSTLCILKKRNYYFWSCTLVRFVCLIIPHKGEIIISLAFLFATGSDQCLYFDILIPANSALKTQKHRHIFRAELHKCLLYHLNFIFAAFFLVPPHFLFSPLFLMYVRILTTP